MLIDISPALLQTIADKTCATLKQELVDLAVQSMTPLVNYNDIPRSMSIDDYHPNTDAFYDLISAMYQDLVTALQQTAEADASPRVYWDLAEKLLLRCVADCISSTQDDMRSENSDSTFKSEPKY